MKTGTSPATLAVRVADTTIILCAAALLYAGWLYLHRVGYRLDVGAMIVGLIPAATATLVTCLFVRFEAKRNIALLATAMCLSFLAGNFALKLSGRSLAAILETKLFRPFQGPAAISLDQPSFMSPQPPDSRDLNQVHAALAAADIDAASMFEDNPPPFLPLLANGKIPPFSPLSTRSRAVMLGCNEGDQRDFPIWHTDRYGFNNDDTVYASSARILIVGDSFAWGSCVQQSENVAAVLRRAGYPTSSVGVGGYGPIFELATLKEYGERFKPKIVLWLYFDGNDISDLKDKGVAQCVLVAISEGRFFAAPCKPPRRDRRVLEIVSLVAVAA